MCGERAEACRRTSRASPLRLAKKSIVVGNPFDHAESRVGSIRLQNGVEEFRLRSAGSDARAVRTPGYHGLWPTKRAGCLDHDLEDQNRRLSYATQRRRSTSSI